MIKESKLKKKITHTTTPSLEGRPGKAKNTSSYHNPKKNAFFIVKKDIDAHFYYFYHSKIS